MEALQAPRPWPSRTVLAAMSVALLAAIALAVVVAPLANWDLGVAAVLFGCAVVSDLTAIDASGSPRHGISISGSFIALVLSMAFLGGAPAAAIGVAAMLVGHLRYRERADRFLNNLLAYAWFPLAGGLVFDVARGNGGLGPGDGTFYTLIPAVFAISLAINFLVIALFNCHLDGEPLSRKARRMVLPVLQWDIAAALLTVGAAYLYNELGLPALAIFVVLLMSSQSLLGQVLASERRAEELQSRTEELDTRVQQLSRMHVGMLSTMLRSLDLRDRMTARHSAAVARYSREIARAAGLPEADQELVHTAGLLHDIGKFVFPDRILTGDMQLTGADWEIIRSHPEEGANLVGQLDGYEAVAEVIRAHHERVDGGGYPRGLRGDTIPLLSRIISVADTYDVMTARDSYRAPTSSHNAIAELQSVAGSQLDADLVQVFVGLLEDKDLRYRHGVDADFDAELGLEKRIEAYAAGSMPGASA
jgi:putative nucleotidyltransferase with HDIG domain